MQSLLSPLLITLIGACVRGWLDDTPLAAPDPPRPDDTDPAAHAEYEGSLPIPTAQYSSSPQQDRPLTDEEVEGRFDDIISSYEGETAWDADPPNYADTSAAASSRTHVGVGSRRRALSRVKAGAAHVLYTIRSNARKHWPAMVTVAAAVLTGMKARGRLGELGHQLLDAFNHIRPNPGFT